VTATLASLASGLGSGGLMADADGDLLGTTAGGGVFALGTVLELVKIWTGYVRASSRTWTRHFLIGGPVSANSGQLARDRNRRRGFGYPSSKHERPNLDLGDERQHPGRRWPRQSQSWAKLASRRADLMHAKTPILLGHMQRIWLSEAVAI
jgi:hypothetical protein